jgi:hypothetical protein
MARYPNGQPIRIPVTVRDVNGALADATTLGLVVQKPDATQTSYTPTHDSTGLYHQDLPATPDLAQNGHYLWVATATGTNAGVSTGTFDVYDPFEIKVLPLQDAKDTVNIPAATSTYDAELQNMVDTVTSAIESLTGGPAVNRAISERCRLLGNSTALAVRKRPLVSVTSITDISSGQAMTLTDLDVDPATGIIQRKRLLPFYGWGPWYQVVYLAGWGTSVPAAFNLSARLIVDHLWQTSRGPGQTPAPALEEIVLPGMSYAIPNRAIEVLRGTDPANGLPYLQEAYV